MTLHCLFYLSSLIKGINDYKSAVMSCIPLSNEFFNDLMEYSDEMFLPVPVVRSGQRFMELQMSSWKKVFHDIFGICYSLGPQSWNKWVSIRVAEPAELLKQSPDASK